MPRIITYLSDELIQNLKEISTNSGKSISKITAELIETGYKIKHNKDVYKLNLEDEKKKELVDKHTEYLLRIMSIVGDIYRCVRNEKSKYEEENVDDAIKTIIESNIKYIEGYLGKDQ